MSRKKFKKGSSPRFVKIDYWIIDCEAWLDLKPGPRALYLEMKRFYNGSNNGQLFLSHRDAGNCLNVGRDTVSTYFQSLVDHGFIFQTRGHCKGPSGTGEAAHYALTEVTLNGVPARRRILGLEKTKSP